jgi:large subunit ribosomal protein L10
MENPRPEKVAVIDEVRSKFESADAVLLTEYRGLKVTELEELRAAMRGAGGDYRIYKNTLVRRAAQSLELELDELLVGPTAIAFVSGSEGTPGDVAAVAKALQSFAKGNPLLIVKGGVLGDAVLDAAGAVALASLPTASEIYSRLAGALNSGARGLAGAVSGVHRSIALVLQAAIDAGAFAGEPASSTPEVAEAAGAEETQSETVADTDADTAEAAAEAPATPEAADAAPATDTNDQEEN